MLKTLYTIFAIMTISLGAYGLITRDFHLNFLMIFFMGLALFVLAIREFQQQRKVYGWLLIIVCLFSTFVSIQSLVLT
ncbi:DUF3953 domain-containing protein [Lysinibacillus macroides]|uniref:DUF3953 domain-containing protein n=1 Tax=Lysinibacillus macroides TaxID=33935 RepID=A0A0M9DLQ5_9BACI|nr:DUF3953 domain-containing protein [Lysinibacillus macroides]KOY83459.1 hypothetical protein ADM90_09390 [Lysinibacillus macroides]